MRPPRTDAGPPLAPRAVPPQRLALHVGRLVVAALRYGCATRRVSIIAAIILGLLLLALTISAQSAAPLLIYPFA